MSTLLAGRLLASAGARDLALAPATRPGLAPTSAPATTAPAVSSSPVDAAAELTWAMLWGTFGFLLFVAVVITVVAWLLGAFRRGVTAGPERISRHEPVWTALLALLVGVVMFVFTFILVAAASAGLGGENLLDPGLAHEAVEAADAPVAGGGDADAISPEQMLLAMRASSFAYVAAAGLALALYALLRSGGMAGRMGLGIAQLPRGLLVGLVALVIVMPWMLTAGVALNMVRKALRYPPEAIHEVLKAIRDNPEPQTILWALVSAVVVAPVAEEILFRGLLQTSFVYGLPRLFGRPHDAPLEAEPMPLGTPPAPEAMAGPAPIAYYGPARARPSPVPASYPPSAGWRWTGIVLTSALFAGLHEPWSIPLIFLLALFFGYVYERTGNLWATIAMHFGFNALNTLFVLLTLVAA